MYHRQLVVKYIVLLCIIGFSNLKPIFAQPQDYFTPKAIITPAHLSPKCFYSSFGYDGGLDFNLSYSLPYNIALFATGAANIFNYSRNPAVGGSYSISKNDFGFTTGLGYYKNRRYKRINIIEIYSGFGLTSIDNFRRLATSTTNSSDIFTEARYATLFGQANATVKRKSLEFSALSRLSYNRYSKFSTYRRSQTEEQIATNPFGIVTLDPAISFAFYAYNLKPKIQLGVSLPFYSQKAEMLTLQNQTTSIEDYGKSYFFWRISVEYRKVKSRCRK